MEAGDASSSLQPLSTCFICLKFVWTSIERLIVFHDSSALINPGAFVSVRYNWYNCREACPQSWARLNSSPSLSTGWWESKLHQWLLVGVAPETSRFTDRMHGVRYLDHKLSLNVYNCCLVSSIFNWKVGFHSSMIQSMQMYADVTLVFWNGNTEVDRDVTSFVLMLIWIVEIKLKSWNTIWHRLKTFEIFTSLPARFALGPHLRERSQPHGTWPGPGFSPVQPWEGRRN